MMNKKKKFCQSDSLFLLRNDIETGTIGSLIKEIQL